MPRHPNTTSTTIALITCLFLGFTLARAPLTIDANAVPFADEPSETAVDLRWNDGLVLVFGNGDLGTATITDDDADNYQTRGFDRIHATAALRQSGLLERFGSGVTYLHDCCNLHTLQHTYTQRLTQLGFDVVAPHPTILHAIRDHHSYRLVFSREDTESVRVYIGP